jgi:hypothetical protein
MMICFNVVVVVIAAAAAADDDDDDDVTLPFIYNPFHENVFWQSFISVFNKIMLYVF